MPSTTKQKLANLDSMRSTEEGIDKKKECKKIASGAKSYQHLKFPSGPPPQYLTGLKPLNFGVQMGSGALGLVWPTANITFQSDL